MKHYRWLAPFLAITLSACSGKASDNKPAEEKPKTAAAEVKPIRVRTAPLSKGAIASIIETTSNIEAESLTDVYPKTAGIIAKVFVEEGETVEPGTVLAKIEDEELRLKAKENEVAFKEAQYRERQMALANEEWEKRKLRSRTNADQAKRDYERNKNLAAASDGKTSLISEKDLEASKLGWDRAEGEDEIVAFASRKASMDLENSKIATERARLTWDVAKIQLADTEIKAKIRGVVSFRGIKLGETVTTMTRAFTVVDLDHLLTNFYRPQKELKYLLPNIPMEAICDAFPDGKFTGSVLRINPVVDPSSGTFKVTAKIDNPEHLLRPGMMIRTKIKTAQHDEAYLVSKKAIFFEGEKPVIFAVREGIAVRIPLEAGFSDLDKTEVLNISDNAVRPNDRIVVVGNAELRDGAKVEIVEG